MKSSQDSFETNGAAVQDTSTMPNILPTQTSVDVTPPVGITPPQVLAQEAANGRRGAAWKTTLLDYGERSLCCYRRLVFER